MIDLPRETRGQMAVDWGVTRSTRWGGHANYEDRACRGGAAKCLRIGKEPTLAE